MKQGLAERDFKLQRYHLAGRVQEQGQEATFEFFYRFPNKMRGELKTPVKRTFSFDGQTLFEMAEDAKTFTTYELKLPPKKSVLFLTQTFAPFAPEGFRAPLLTTEGVTAQRVTHPKAPDAVEVSVTTHDDEGKQLSVRYTLRWPSLDFLGRKTEVGGRTVEIRVEAEHCEAALKMCFPQKLTQWEEKDPVATTTLSKVEINPPLPAESFTLSAPEGYEAKKQELVEN